MVESLWEGDLGVKISGHLQCLKGQGRQGGGTWLCLLLHQATVCHKSLYPVQKAGSAPGNRQRFSLSETITKFSLMLPRLEISYLNLHTVCFLFLHSWIQSHLKNRFFFLNSIHPEHERASFSCLRNNTAKRLQI